MPLYVSLEPCEGIGAVLRCTDARVLAHVLASFVPGSFAMECVRGFLEHNVAFHFMLVACVGHSSWHAAENMDAKKGRQGFQMETLFF